MAVLTNAEIAKLVVTELGREGMVLPADAVHDAEYYVEQAYALLAGMSSYSAATLAASLARDAVVEFAKNRFRGQPGDSGDFARLVQRWMRAAAVAHHDTNDLGLLIDPTDQAYFG